MSLAGAAAPTIGRRLFEDMLRIRLISEAVAARYPEQQMRCPVHLSIGQEGVASGVCAALERTDYLVSTHRPHAHYLAKGGSLRGMISEFYGKATGCCSGRGGSMHLIDLDVGMLGSTPIVGGSLPVAVGAAFGTLLAGTSEVTVVFFGDGTTEEGVFLESLNFAALKELPVIFVCENNLYSVYSPLSVRQHPDRDRSGIARAHGMPAVHADGNDAELVYTHARDAVARARAGGGPTYLEFDTYRWREHCGPYYDNDLGYRTEAEFLEWRERDPVALARRRSLEAGEITQAGIAALESAIASEIEDAFAFALAAPFPDDDLMSHLFAQSSPQ